MCTPQQEGPGWVGAAGRLHPRPRPGLCCRAAPIMPPRRRLCAGTDRAAPETTEGAPRLHPAGPQRPASRAAPGGPHRTPLGAPRPSAPGMRDPGRQGAQETPAPRRRDALGYRRGTPDPLRPARLGAAFLPRVAPRFLSLLPPGLVPRVPGGAQGEGSRRRWALGSHTPLAKYRKEEKVHISATRNRKLTLQPLLLHPEGYKSLLQKLTSPKLGKPQRNGEMPRHL